MFTNISLNCQPIRNQKLAFGLKDTKQEEELLTKAKQEEPAGIKEEVQPEVKTEAPKFRNLKAFGKGFVAPVTNIFDDGIIQGAATLALGFLTTGLIIKKLGENSRKVMVPVFAGFGALTAGKGAYKLATSKGDAEVKEKAFHDMGEGSAIAGLALLASKPAVAKSSGIPAKKLNFSDSFKTCFKDFGASIQKCKKFLFQKGPKPETSGIGSTPLSVDAADINPLDDFLLNKIESAGKKIVRKIIGDAGSKVTKKASQQKD